MLATVAVMTWSLVGSTVPISIDNWRDGEVSRTPWVIVRGVAPGDSVSVDAPDADPVEFQIHEGRFVAIAALVPGENEVRFEASDGTVADLRLTYEPLTSNYTTVPIMWFGADDEPVIDDGQGGLTADWHDRMDTAYKLMQAGTAEMMRDAGYERKTFTLPFDENGRVVVETRFGPLTGDEMRELSGGDMWGNINRWLHEDKPQPHREKYGVIAGYSRWNAETRQSAGHTALGGGNLALFGSSSVYTWPETLADVAVVFSDATLMAEFDGLDDSGGRSTVWGSAATTLGAMLHELGHAFGLPHGTHPFCVMTRGFDRFNRLWTTVEPPRAGQESRVYFTDDQQLVWEPAWAAALNLSLWFQPDPQTPEGQSPQIRFDEESDRVTVEAEGGLRLLVAWVDTFPVWLNEISPGVDTVTLNRDEIFRRLARADGSLPENFEVWAYDAFGRRTTQRVPGTP